MKQATSKDIQRIRQEIIDRYPNNSISNFGIIFVDDRWIVGLIINGIRYVGEARTPYDAYYALELDLEKNYERHKDVKGGIDDDSNPDPDRVVGDISPS